MNRLMRNRCWLKHRYKEDWEVCPLCRTPIRWVYSDGEWTPCDREAISYVRDLDGKLIIYNGKELIEYCKAYTKGMNNSVRMGLLPHVFSCDELKGYHGVKVLR